MLLEHKYRRSLSGFIKKSHAEDPTKQLKSVTKVAKEGSTDYLLFLVLFVGLTDTWQPTIGSFFIFFNQRKQKKN